MTKNRSMRIAVLVLALALITCCFVGTTFAKYTSTASGTSTVTTAKWSFNVGTTDIATTDSLTGVVNLFETINDTGNTADEKDVVDNKIAPGTAGSFAIELENTSDVSATYTVALVADDTELNGVPIKFSLTGAVDSWTTDLAEITVTNDILVTAVDKTATVTIYWMWDFNDAGVDNTHANKTVTVAYSVTASQKD